MPAAAMQSCGRQAGQRTARIRSGSTGTPHSQKKAAQQRFCEWARNSYVYGIESVNITTGELFNDRKHVIYVNGSYEGDSDIGKLMHDFRCSNPDDMYYDLVKTKTKYLKESEEGVLHMCKIMEEALEQEARETRVIDIKNLMEEMRMSAEQAMKALRIPQDEQATYAKLIK